MEVVWGEGAREDFDRAVDFMTEQSPAGAQRVGAKILKAVALLEHFPEIAPASKHRGLRQLVVTKTPYLVVYRVEADRVEIRAVIHAKQRRRK